LAYQFVDESVVISYSRPVDVASSNWKNSWPRNGESVCIHIEVLQDLDVFLIAMILIYSNVSSGIPIHMAYTNHQ
jgi:hypothetical protein